MAGFGHKMDIRQRDISWAPQPYVTVVEIHCTIDEARWIAQALADHRHRDMRSGGWCSALLATVDALERRNAERDRSSPAQPVGEDS